MTTPPLDCEEVLRQLLAYLDQEIDPHAQAAIGQHLERCRSCFDRAEFEHRVKDWLRATGSRRASTALVLRLRNIVERY